MRSDTDVVVVGAGLSGLVAATELADAGRRVVVVDQEPEASLGGQAYWSFGGLFLVDTPEQRRLGVRDSYDLALQDWMGSAGFDRAEDHWPRRWAEAYVAWAAGEKRAWLRAQGVRFFPVVGWAERGGYLATDHGNSVPRFHVTWGTGPGVVEPFARRAREAERGGRLAFHFRHRVTGLSVTGGVVDGVTGEVLRPGRRRARPTQLAGRRRRLHRPGAGGDRHFRRHRRQPRAGPHPLARPPGRAAGPDALRGAGLRGRADARGRGGGGGAPHQPRPDVALPRGGAELGPGLAAPRRPHPPGAVVGVAGRPRQPAPGAAVPGVRLARHPRAPRAHGLRPFLVRPVPEDLREGIRPGRLGTEPRPHEPELAAGPRPGRPAERPGAGRGVQAARRRLHRRGPAAGPRPPDERAGG